MYRPNTTWTWSFLLVAIFQAIIGLALEGYVFGKFESQLNDKKDARTNSPPSRTVPTYASVFMFAYLYQLVLVYDALRLKNTIQVIGICIYNIGILIYAAIQIDQIKDSAALLSGKVQIIPLFWRDVQPFLIALPCVMGIGTILLSFVAWKLYDEFAWTIYKHISADLRLKRRYLTYQVYIALLKFDFFFFLGFTVQFLVIVTNTKDVEFYLTIAAIPITIALLFLAAYWTRRESVLGMVFIIAIYFGALGYFFFKLIRMYGKDQRVKDYIPARRMLTTFAVITIGLLIVTIIVACMCTHNFNKGLKPHVAKRKVSNEAELPAKNQYGNYATEMPEYRFNGSNQAGSRMTID